MSKKSSTPKRTRRTTAPRPPIGLSAAFKLIALQGEDAAGAAAFADECFPHATRVIKNLHGRVRPNVIDSYNGVEDELLAATRTLYPPPSKDDDTAASPSCVSMAAFRVGFAVCWLLMTQMNGGAR